MGFFDKLKNGLNKTKTSFDEKMNDIFSNFRKVDEDLLEELEEALIMSDVGANTSATIINNLSKNYRAPLNGNYGFILLHSTGAHNFERDVPLVYADYYFLEALLKKEKLEKEGTAIL